MTLTTLTLAFFSLKQILVKNSCCAKHGVLLHSAIQRATTQREIKKPKKESCLLL